MDYDYIIAGGGMAGLSLAWHLVDGLSDGSRILVVDKEAKTRNDRTWCFWHQDPVSFDHLAFRRWKRIGFRSPGFTRDIDLENWTYSMIRGIDFYTWVQAELAKSQRVDMVYGAIEAITDHGEAPSVTVNQRQYTARWIFDGTYTAGQFVVPPDRHDLKQHFKGWFIETTRPVFDPEVPVMFDLRIPQDGAFRFMYILPESPVRALVEYTFFSHSLLDDEGYHEGLRTYIAGTLGLADDEYRIVEEEKGVIPMTDMPLPRRLGQRIMAIGSKGGRVKASTGFAFYRTQKDHRRIVQAIKERGNPFTIPPDPPRYRTFDTMLLQILYRQPDRGAEIFSILFRRNPIGRLFRFLNEEGGIPENLALMASVPWWPFIAAWFKAVVFRRI